MKSLGARYDELYFLMSMVDLGDVYNSRSEVETSVSYTLDVEARDEDDFNVSIMFQTDSVEKANPIVFNFGYPEYQFFRRCAIDNDDVDVLNFLDKIPMYVDNDLIFKEINRREGKGLGSLESLLLKKQMINQISHQSLYN